MGTKGDAESASDGCSLGIPTSISLPCRVVCRVVSVLAANELPVEMRGTAASSSLLTKASPLALKIPAVAATQKDVKGLVVSESRRLPSEIPHYIQRLMGKETGKLSLGTWVPHLLPPLITPLQQGMEGHVLKYTPPHMI